MNAYEESLLAEIYSLLERPAVLGAVGIGLAAFGVVWCQIFAKAGFRARTGLLMLVPGVNVVAFLIFAFAPWPVRREARLLKKMKKKVHRADQRHQRKVETVG